MNVGFRRIDYVLAGGRGTSGNVESLLEISLRFGVNPRSASERTRNRPFYPDTPTPVVVYLVSEVRFRTILK